MGTEKLHHDLPVAFGIALYCRQGECSSNGFTYVSHDNLPLGYVNTAFLS